MKRGEKGILIITVAVVVGLMAWNYHRQSERTANDSSIPFYSTASAELSRQAGELIRRHECRSCHTLWTLRDMLRAVPAPALDGIGSLRDQDWLYAYLSADDPQRILPTRLKKEYQMPSYAGLPEHERRILAEYLASLKVEDWYLEEARMAECSKLTGGNCQ
jgi:sulfur-oxidizing protein SoxX